MNRWKAILHIINGHTWKRVRVVHVYNNLQEQAAGLIAR